MKKITDKPAERDIYIWNLLGNLAAAAVSVLYLMIVSRLQSSEIADQYSLAISIGNLWVIIGLFQVRNYQATDINETYSFASYTTARAISIGLMWLFLFPYLAFVNYDLTSFFSVGMIVLLILYRSCDALSDLFQGLFQQHFRLDIAGKSMVFRYLGSVLLLLAALLLSGDLLFGLLAVFIYNLLFILFFDYRYSSLFFRLSWRELTAAGTVKGALKILKDCSSLFLYGFLINLIFNEPKLAIAAQLQEGRLQTGVQRDFNILFMPVFFMSLCVLVVRPLITSLASMRADGNMEGFFALVRRLFLILFVVGLLVTAASYVIGTPVLSLLFGVDLSPFSRELAVLVFSGILYSAAIVFENILTIYRRHSLLLIVYLVMYVLSLIITRPAIESRGLMGASISFLFVMFVYAIGSYLIYLFVKRKENNASSS